VGCLLTYHVKNEKIIRVEGRDGPANFSRLCVKGRYGFDYVNHKQRLLKPLIRREGIPKGLNEHFDPSDPTKMFREATWEEAMALTISGLKKLKVNSVVLAWRALVLLKAVMKKLIYSRNSSGLVLARTMSTTARGYVTPPVLQPYWKGLDQVPYRIRSKKLKKPKSF